MPVWNGMQVSPEAHRVALGISRLIGPRIADTTAVSGPLKGLLRNFYSATGGKRGPKVGFEPSAVDLRRCYNGEADGAAIYAAHTGSTPRVTEAVAKAKAEPVKVPEAPVSEADAKLKALQDLLGGSAKLDPEEVKALASSVVDTRIGEVLASMGTLVAAQVAQAVTTVKITVANLPEVTLDKAHKDLPTLLLYIANRENVMLVGPAGCGKTFMARQAAETLGLPYYFSGKCVDETKLLGFIDAGGTYRPTAFRKAYEFGGVFLADEMDSWSPDALIALNAPLADDLADFPDAQVKRHADFVMVAATNTFCRGADALYVAREQLDAASLDRFAVEPVEYDEGLENSIAPHPEWTAYVQKVRAAVLANRIEHVVSPRASIKGGKMLLAGHDRAKVEEAYVWKGLDTVQRDRIKASMR